ncbi:hypothetical protein OOZ15_07775, partial [Galbibacter sp. EGI 63066]|nr:hypothetical protein [Galbibacter sp. EGI 63066]
VPASVVNQFEEILNEGPVTIDGNTYNTFEEYLEQLVAGNETVTTLVDNGDGTYDYTSEDGTVTTVDVPASVVNQFEEILNEGPVTIDGNTYNTFEEYLEQLVAGNETVTNLVDNGDGTITYTNEDGTAQTVDIATMVEANETLTTLVDNGDGTMTYTDEEGMATVIDMASIISSNETLTTLVDNGDGTMTYTDEDGVATVITTTVLSDNAQIPDGTVDIDGDGTPDNGVTLQDVINNLTTIIDANETLTTLVDNGDGTITYTDEDGAATVIDMVTIVGANETVTNLVDNGDGTITYTNEEGTAQTVDIATMVEANETVTNLVDNGDGTITYTNEEGTAQTVDIATASSTEPWFSTATSGPATSNTERKYSIGDIGIGTDSPNPSAQLDLSKTDKGLLLPRVALTSITDVVTIATPEAGMFVYNTTVDSDENLGENVYFFDGTKWVAPLLSERTGTVAPTPEVVDNSGAQFNLTADNIYVVGPFTVSQSGWYDISFRWFFSATPNGGPITDNNALLWTQISTSSDVLMDTGAVVADSRFVISRQFTNTPSYGFKYLTVGTSYYFKYVYQNLTSYIVDVSAERLILLTPFQ